MDHFAGDLDNLNDVRDALIIQRGLSGGTLTFAYYRSSDHFFRFKILNFAIFWGVEVLSTNFMGMPI